MKVSTPPENAAVALLILFKSIVLPAAKPVISAPNALAPGRVMLSLPIVSRNLTSPLPVTAALSAKPPACASTVPVFVTFAARLALPPQQTGVGEGESERIAVV